MLMKRVVAAVFALALLAPAAQLIAAACGASACCASEETSMRMVMACCEPAMCADPTPEAQPAAVTTNVVTLAAIDIVAPETLATPAAVHPEPASFATPPPPTRVRLAHLSTLLI